MISGFGYKARGGFMLQRKIKNNFMYEIKKENVLNIPIGTKLHFTSFFDKPKLHKRVWDVVGVYNYQDSAGKLYCINQEQFNCLKGTYITYIVSSWTLEFIYEGEEYWKVFSTERVANCYKLEFDGKKHQVALPLKPYKDIVHSNTNFMSNYGVQRFSSLSLADEYCYAVKNNINFHNIIDNK